jgi:hypothetical protein
MNILSYQLAIRIFFLGFVILFIGVGANKGFGFVGLGVVITFLGFGVCVVGMIILAVIYIKKVLR